MPVVLLIIGTVVTLGVMLTTIFDDAISRWEDRVLDHVALRRALRRDIKKLENEQ